MSKFLDKILTKEFLQMISSDKKSCGCLNHRIGEENCSWNGCCEIAKNKKGYINPNEKI